jgi:predicted hotdog family 3-hydroxylacyl-ACP dehydratase
MKNTEIPETTESIGKIPVGELLPQKGKFVMIDKLNYLDETRVSSSLTVKKNNIFLDGDLFSEPGIVENIAQTAAARMGYIGKYIDNSGVRIGFIGEIKNLAVNRCPRVGEKLTTTIEIVNELFSTLLVHTETRVNGDLIASGSMKIAMTDILPAD